MNKLLSIIAEEFGVTVEIIKGRVRLEEFIRPRFVAYYILYQRGYNTLKISKIMKKDRTTVYSGYRQAANMLETDSNFKKKFDKVSERLKKYGM
jgi:chromosomal replication initiation ATPase DnaA